MKILPQKGVLVAFGEWFLKSEGVKEFFQRKLSQNISFFLEKEGLDFKLYSFRERIFVQTEDSQKALKILKNVFGIAWLSECFYFPQTNLKEFADFIAKNYKNWIKEKQTFALRLRLEKGLLKEDSKKVIEKIAEKIERKVDLDNPKKEIFIEIRKGGWFLYFKKEQGFGGLPSGASGKVLVLMSGGIDSPAASFLIAKRGAENIWLHFHSFPLVSNKSIEKTKELARLFLNFQPRLKIYFVPFHKAQITIKAKAPANYRVLLYRRLMFKIAEQIAKKQGCLALATGEGLGQVSSQTLPNMGIIEEGTKIPIFRPLIGFDKEEIIKLAKKIKTFEISIKPQEDCCTLFISKRQSACGNPKTIKEIEKKLNIKKIIQQIIKGIKIEKY